MRYSEKASICKFLILWSLHFSRWDRKGKGNENDYPGFWCAFSPHSCFFSPVSALEIGEGNVARARFPFFFFLFSFFFFLSLSYPPRERSIIYATLCKTLYSLVFQAWKNIFLFLSFSHTHSHAHLHTWPCIVGVRREIWTFPLCSSSNNPNLILYLPSTFPGRHLPKSG